MKRGFTLTEVLVTLVIISVGMTALFMAFSLTLSLSGNIEAEETALDLANAVMEQLRGTAYTNLQDFTEDGSVVFSGLTGYTVQVTTTKPINPAQVNATVSWAVKGGTANITLTTLAADH